MFFLYAISHNATATAAVVSRASPKLKLQQRAEGSSLRDVAGPYSFVSQRSRMTEKEYKTLTTKVERKYQIPGGLLYAIMMVESKGHPFAVYSNQKGRRNKSVRFNTVQEAVEYVTILQSMGARNINVGCMQINLKCHKSKNLALWFSPEYNMEYAGRFLQILKKRMGSWKNAVAFYHSGTKDAFHETYLNKVNHYFMSGNLWEM